MFKNKYREKFCERIYGTLLNINGNSLKLHDDDEQTRFSPTYTHTHTLQR